MANFYETLPKAAPLSSRWKFHVQETWRNLILAKTATFGAKNLCAFLNKFPALAITTITEKSLIHISVVIKSMKPLGMSTI